MPTYTVINPATEQPVRTVPSTSAQETDAAIERAAAAQVSWRATAPGERAALLRAFAAQSAVSWPELEVLLEQGGA
jgi:acyl-CoA reductase-like NAD-dependent aldehyde dehydrogenase